MRPVIVVRNWLALVAVILGLSGVAWIVGQYISAGLSATVITAGWAALAGFGLVDGVLRVLGLPAILGSSSGFSRALAAIQVLLSLFLLAGILGIAL